MTSDFVLAVDAAVVDQALEAYLRDPDVDPPEAVRGAQLHRVLPLWKDWVGCIALQSNGQLVFFSWDDPAKLEPVGAAGDHDRRMVHAARAQGSRRFPTIRGLAPTRGADAGV